MNKKIDKDRTEIRSGGRVQIEFVEFLWGRPPKVSLIFDIMLRNEQADPRWFLLPDSIAGGPRQKIGPIEAVEVYKLAGTGSVIIGHFRGSGGFYAMRLPGGAELTLRRFPIPMWSPPPESVAFEAITATSLLIDGEPGEYWFEMSPDCDTRAEVHADALAEQKRVIAGRTSKGPDELDVTIVGDERTRVKADLRRP